QQVRNGGLQRQQDRPEGQEQDDAAEPDDDQDHLGQLVADAAGQVDVGGRLAAHLRGEVGSLDGLRDHVVAQAVDRVLRRRGPRRRRRYGGEHRGRSRRVEGGGRDRLDARVLLDGVLEARQPRVGGRRLPLVLGG